MKSILAKLNILLNKKQKKRMSLLVIMMLIGAVLEVAGIGMVVPAVKLVMDEEAIRNDKLVSTIYDILPVSNQRQFIIVIMVSLMAIFVLKNLKDLDV